MLKAAIEKILSLDAPHIEEIEGRTYVDKDMTQIGKELRATSITSQTRKNPNLLQKRWRCRTLRHSWKLQR